MKTRVLDVHVAQAQLVELIAVVAAGNEIILTEGDAPLARIVPITGIANESAVNKRIAGLHAGSIEASEDFDEPLPDEFWMGAE